MPSSCNMQARLSIRSTATILEDDWSSGNVDHARRIVQELRDLADRIDIGDGVQKLPQGIVIAVMGESNFQIVTSGKLSIEDLCQVGSVLQRDAMKLTASSTSSDQRDTVRLAVLPELSAQTGCDWLVPFDWATPINSTPSPTQCSSSNLVQTAV